jgi:DNA repair photolyase
MPALLRAAYDAGAQYAGFVPIKLPRSVAPLFEDWLERHFPERKEKVLNRIRDIRGGRLHDSRFGYRMTGQGAYAEGLRSLFHATCNTLGLDTSPAPFTTEHFKRPAGPQLPLFD